MGTSGMFGMLAWPDLRASPMVDSRSKLENQHSHFSADLGSKQDNSREYRPTEDANILFISDVGAEHHWLFITGAVLTIFFYWMTMLFERWLRHVDRIPYVCGHLMAPRLIGSITSAERSDRVKGFWTS